MTPLRGYDTWKTREPQESFPVDLGWHVETYDPHRVGGQVRLGPFESEEEAVTAAAAWVEKMRAVDTSVYRDEYGYETPHSVDLNEDCTCARGGRWRKYCPAHGDDPDAAYDARFE